MHLDRKSHQIITAKHYDNIYTDAAAWLTDFSVPVHFLYLCDRCDVDQLSQSFRQLLDDDVRAVRTAADRCEVEIQRLADAEQTLNDRVEAVRSQIDARRDQLIAAIDREVAQLQDSLSGTQNSGVEKLRRSRDRMGKQTRMLRCVENVCGTVVEAGTVREVMHIHGCVHDEDLPLQQVPASDAEIPELRFTPVDVEDFLPRQERRLIGWVSVGDGTTVIQQPTWNQLLDRLNQTVEEADRLQRQTDDQQRYVACLEEQLTEKTGLLDTAGRELQEKSSLVDELERQTSDMAAAVEEREAALTSLRDELQQRDATLDEYSTQVEALSQGLHDARENYERQLLERELKVEQRTRDLCESQQSAAEYRSAVERLSVRVQQLEQSLSYSVDKSEQMETQLEDAWQQISEQSIVIEHVPPTAGQTLS